MAENWKAALVAALVVSAAPASADTITYSGSVSERGVSPTFELPRVSLDNILNSVTYSVSYSVSAVLPLNSNATYPYSFDYFVSAGTGLFGGIQSSGTQIVNEFSPFGASFGGSGTVSGTITGDALATFIGTGNLSNFVGSTVSVNGQTLIERGRGASESVSYKVTYDFTPMVPEPSTWALMLLGFGMAAYGLRRRRANLALA